MIVGRGLSAERVFSEAFDAGLGVLSRTASVSGPVVGATPGVVTDGVADGLVPWSAGSEAAA